MADNKRENIKAYIDVLCAFFFIAEFLMPIWGVNFNKLPIIIAKIPAPLFFMAVGLIPAGFSVIWLLSRLVSRYRGENAWKGKLILYAVFFVLATYIIVFKFFDIIGG